MQSSDASWAFVLLSVAIWGALFIVEGLFIWLFFWLLYARGRGPLSKARLSSVGLALVGVVLIPSGAYLSWFGQPGQSQAWTPPPRPEVLRATPAPKSFSLDRASAERGQKLFQEQNCVACHRVQGQGGAVAPDLWGVANRRDPEWIFRHFQDPQKVSPGTLMPRFPLSDDEFRDLTAYLLTLRDNR